MRRLLISKLGRLLRRTDDFAAGYVESLPTDQHVLDIFKGEWSSRLPGTRKELKAGAIPLFEDSRILWAAEQFGGFAGQRVLELGPLEGGHSYMLESLGADSVLAVEASQRAYLKCLITKEILELKRCRFMLGDCVAYLHALPQAFDVCLASGILYHMRNPVELLYLLSVAGKKVFLWTHFYDETIIAANAKLARKFAGTINSSYKGFDHVLHRYNYGLVRKQAGFCGGTRSYSNWMSRDDILSCLRFFGFEDLRVGFEEPHHPNGPAFCVAALRS